MHQSSMETALLWIVRFGVGIIVFLTPIIVAPTLFFPYITGKNFFFRIAMELTFGVWLALATLYPQYRPRRGLVLVVFSVFIAVTSVAALFGVDPYYSFWSNFERMEGIVTYLHLFALFLVTSSVFYTMRQWSMLLHVSIAASILVTLYGFLEWTGSVMVPGSTAGEGGVGIFSTLGNQIYLAAYLLFHFFLLALAFFGTKNNWLRFGYIAILFAEFFIFLFTGTRGAMIGLAGGCIAALVGLMVFSFKTHKKISLAAGALLLVGGVAVFTLIQYRDSDFVRSRDLLARIADIRATSNTAQSRFMIWNIAWEGFKERPLLGWGSGNFIIPYATYYNPDLFGNEPWFDRVHNMHLEWLFAAGILGFAGYIGLIISGFYIMVRLWWKNMLSSFQSAVAAGALVAYLGQNTFVFDTIITYLFFVLLLAFLQSMATARTQETVAANAPPRSLPSAEGGYMFLAAFFVVAAIGVVIVLNIKHIRVASGIIDMLNTVGQGRTVADITKKLDDLAAARSFGTTEARDRFVDVVLAATRQQSNIPPADLLFLVSRGADEMKKEVERQPKNVKSLIALGKLLQLRFVATGSEKDRDEAIRIYEQAIAQAPHYPSSHIGLAEVYLAAQDYTRAMATMDEIFQKMTRPTPFIYSLLSVSVLGGDYAKAAEQAKRYITLGNTPIYPLMSHFDRNDMEGVLQRVRNGVHTQETERFLEVIFNHQKDNLPLLFITLAEVKADLGKFDEAKQIAEELLQRDPSYKTEVEAFLQLLENKLAVQSE